MYPSRMYPGLALALVLIFGVVVSVRAADEPPLPGGVLRILDDDGQVAGVCPLKHTEVAADIVGFVSRVTVKQIFHNPTDTKIEAIYIFPLPHDAAVDDMVMTVGERRIIGQIKEREEAREIYEQAKAAGYVASLLNQERPNIFTQSVANIEPGVEVVIEISYVETLKYEDGVFEWVFPMVVGPRYIPGGGSAPAPMTRGTPTPQVPDADRITPPVTPEGTRAGHDISLTVHLDAGMELYELESVLHDLNIDRPNRERAVITLKNQAEIPNKDFVLHYRLGSDEIGDAFLVHSDERGSFFTVVLQPPRRIVPEKLMPRELIFVLDTSGSMSGFPIEKAKQVMRMAIDQMRPADTFNLITFAGDTHILWDKPRPATPKNINEAQTFLAARRGGGGTEMMKAINAALEVGGGRSGYIRPQALLEQPADGRRVRVRVPFLMLPYRHSGFPIMKGGVYGVVVGQDKYFSVTRFELPHWPTEPAEAALLMEGKWITRDGQQVLDAHKVRLESEVPSAIRVVCFMTDGYVGNDMAIIAAVKKNAGTTRVFSFGIGNSVNRFLLDGMARASRGEVEYVTLESQGDAAAERFHERILAPVLTDIELDWGDLPVTEVYPPLIPDLFAAKPIMIHGRLNGPADGVITLRGNTGAGPYETQLSVWAPADATDHEALASLWARAKVEDLMMRDYAAAQQGNFPADLKQEVIDLGLEFRLMTQFTSFVAVEQMTVTAGGEPVTITVPVEMPDGVSYEGVFGGQQLQALRSLGYVGGKSGARGKMRLSMRVAGVGSPAPTPTAGQVVKNAQTISLQEDRQAGEREEAAKKPADPLAKLAEPLRDLAAKVAQAGTDGNLTIGKLKVTDYHVDVMIFLNDISEKTLTALEELGFEQTGESKAVRLLIGTIDVRKLEELAKLDAVVRIKPVVQP